MTSAQISEAEKLVREWKPNYRQGYVAALREWRPLADQGNAHFRYGSKADQNVTPNLGLVNPQQQTLISAIWNLGF